MPPKASTSKLSAESALVTLSRSPSASARAGSLKNGHDNSSSLGTMSMANDADGQSSDEDELVDDHVAARKDGKGTSRSSKQRSSTSGAASIHAGHSPSEDQHVAMNVDMTSNMNSTADGLTKEEIALADRRRRNRETQRAIRKKKANRLQEAELKVSLFETELESLKLRNRDLENEVLVLRRELDDWRCGRIHAHPSIIAGSASGSVLTAGVAPSASSRSSLNAHLNAADNLTWPSTHPEESARSRAGGSAYQSHDIPAEERKILGKRRQSFDVNHQQQLPVSRHYIHPIHADPPSARTVRNHRESPSWVQFTGADSTRERSMSVLQPVPTVSRNISTSIETAAARAESISNAPRPYSLDTNTNEEGAYGGSDPSPSSAGTVIPSYTSAFNPTADELHPSRPASTLISEAVQAVRAQEAALPADMPIKDNVPRSRSIQSTTTSISDRPSSYDEYHDFWTSVSNSQSQSDSLTSMSSYKSSAIGAHRHTSSHLSGAAMTAAGYGESPMTSGAGPNIEEDGIILSMSRSSLCASPLSIAEESEEVVYHDRILPITKDEECLDGNASLAHSQHKLPKPSLPSLSSSLKGRHRASGGLPGSPDRTASLPLPAHFTSASPLQAPYLPAFRAAYPHRLDRSSNPASQGYALGGTPDGLSRTLPPISSVFQEAQVALPRSMQSEMAPPAKKQLLTRNGRGKTTSYPVPDASRHLAEQTSEYDKGSSSFHWPSSAMTASRNTSSYGGLPTVSLLPNGAGTRAPMSSSRDDSDIAMTAMASDAKELLPHVPQQDEEKIASLGSGVDMSPSAYHDEKALDNSAMLATNADEKVDAAQANGDKRLTQRRKSTYEDFVELFGSQGATA